MEPEDAGVYLDVGELDEVLEAPHEVQHPGRPVCGVVVVPGLVLLHCTQP